MLKLFVLTLTLFFTIPIVAMQHDISRITPSTHATNLPDDVITKIAATCHPDARTSFSLVNKLCNQCASIRKEDGEILLDKGDRLYYLFYGCIYNLKNLVGNALCYFNPEDKSLSWREEKRIPDRVLLSQAKYYIQQVSNAEAIQLLPYYVDIEIKQDKPLLAWVISVKEKALFKWLLKQPTIDVNKQNKNGCTALHCIKLTCGHTVEYIQSQIARGIKGWNFALKKAQANNVKAKMIKALVDHPKIDINIQNRDGNTALHKAIEANSTRMVELLLTHPNIDIYIKNDQKKSPLSEACMIEYRNMDYNDPNYDEDIASAIFQHERCHKKTY